MQLSASVYRWKTNAQFLFYYFISFIHSFIHSRTTYLSSAYYIPGMVPVLDGDSSKDQTLTFFLWPLFLSGGGGHR